MALFDKEKRQQKRDEQARAKAREQYGRDLLVWEQEMSKVLVEPFPSNGSREMW